MKRLIRVKVELPATVYRKDAWYIADCRLLRLRSQGRSEDEALHQLQSELELFIEHCHRRGTLDQILGECGFEPVSGPPSEVADDIVIDASPGEHMLAIRVPPAFMVSVPDASHRVG